MDGLTLLGHLRQILPQTPVIIITAYGTVEHAVTAVRSGVRLPAQARQFDDVLIKVQRACRYKDVTPQQQVIADQLAQGSVPQPGRPSQSITRLFDVSRLSSVKSNVLIVGESGTGKELFARHSLQRHHRGKPFVAINCGAFPIR
jgi:DNA-binding NtrC family response regulator